MPKKSRILAVTAVFSAVCQQLKDMAQSRRERDDQRKSYVCQETTVAVVGGILLYPKMETTLDIRGIFNEREQRGTFKGENG